MIGKMINSIILVFLMTPVVWAQAGPKLDISITDLKVNASEEELQTGAINYAPGDTIQYTLTSKNVGDALMKEAVITDPIPAGVTYIVGSAMGDNANILFSVDGGKAYSTWPAHYTVRNSRGIVIRKEAPPEMLTHIRWEIQDEIQPGRAHLSKFDVVVNQ